MKTKDQSQSSNVYCGSVRCLPACVHVCVRFFIWLLCVVAERRIKRGTLWAVGVEHFFFLFFPTALQRERARMRIKFVPQKNPTDCCILGFFDRPWTPHFGCSTSSSSPLAVNILRVYCSRPIFLAYPERRSRFIIIIIIIMCWIHFHSLCCCGSSFECNT